MIALLVALVSVLGSTVPVLVNLLESSRSDVKMSFQKYNDNVVFFVASNDGAKAGAIGNALLELPSIGVDGRLAGKTYFRLESSDPSGFMLGGATRQMSFAMEPLDFREISQSIRAPPKTELAGDALGKIIVAVMQHGGETTLYEQPIGVMCHVRCWFVAAEVTQDSSKLGKAR